VTTSNSDPRAISRFAALLLLFTLGSLISAMPRPVRAAASYGNCTGFITSLPAVIDTPGSWCMNRDLTTAISSGTVISVNADHVTIDCNNYKLGGLAAGEGSLARGIASSDRVYITVRRCNIRGFHFGIALIASDPANGGHLVEDNRLDGNLSYGIYVAGDGSLIRRNLVNDTGFTTLYGGGNGIGVQGWVDVLDNSVAGVTATNGSPAIGIAAFNSSASIVGNRVSGVIGGTQQAGIYAVTLSHAGIRDNNVSGTGPGDGIYCNDSSGVAADNVVNRMGIIGNCSDAGGNDVAPNQ
jgi:hypothetical protein